MYTPDRITKLRPNEVFVFGSNLAGNHAGGAARQAFDSFGAKYGVGEGTTGHCYAFPTLDRNFNKLSVERLKQARDNLYVSATANPNLVFLLTKVGCGIADYPEEEMKALFVDAPNNIVKPEGW